MLVGERAIACVFDLSRHRRLAALACTTGIELGDTWSKLLVIYRISSCGIAWVVSLPSSDEIAACPAGLLKHDFTSHPEDNTPI